MLFGWLLSGYVQGQLAGSGTMTAYMSTDAYTNSHADGFSFLANQASLAQLKNASAGIYSERRFLLAELATTVAVLTMPVAAGNAGLKFSMAGDAAYHELAGGLAYGRKLGSKIDIGVQFDYTGIKIMGYGTAVVWSVELGAVVHLTEKLHTGIHINNPAGGRFSSGEKLPAAYTIGWCYETGADFCFTLQMIKEEGQPVNIHAGLEYVIVPQLFFRGGIVSATSSIYTGIGILWKKTRLDITGSYHPRLGMTPGILLLINFKQQKI